MGVDTVVDREMSALYVRSGLVGLGKERDDEQIQSMLPLWCPGGQVSDDGRDKGPYRSGLRLFCQSWGLGPEVANIKLRVCVFRSEWLV